MTDDADKIKITHRHDNEGRHRLEAEVGGGAVTAGDWNAYPFPATLIVGGRRFIGWKGFYDPFQGFEATCHVYECDPVNADVLVWLVNVGRATAEVQP